VHSALQVLINGALLMIAVVNAICVGLF